jgi:hypothetical protein
MSNPIIENGVVAGQTVMMTEGPFAGWKGTVVETSGGSRVTLSVEFKECSALIEIDSAWVIPSKRHSLRASTGTVEAEQAAAV